MQERKILRAKMIEEEMQRKQNIMYTRFLTTMGIIIMLVVTVILLFNGLVFTRELVAFFSIGLLLSLAGILWTAKDNKDVQNAQEIYMDMGNDDEEGERFSSGN